MRPLSVPNAAEADAPILAPLPPLSWLERANRLATVARLLESTIHEANNALQVISGQAELLAAMAATGKTPLTNKAVQQRSDSIGSRARDASFSLKELLAFARDAPDRSERFSLTKLAEQALGLRRRSLTQLHIDVVVDASAGAVMVVSSQRPILQIVLNLMLNAEEALTGWPSGSLRLQTRRQGDVAELVVEDNGPGLPEEFTANAAPVDPADLNPPAWNPGTMRSNRLGVGLQVARFLAERQEGRLLFTRPETGSGCRVTLSLPAAS